MAEYQLWIFRAFTIAAILHVQGVVPSHPLSIRICHVAAN